MISTGLASAGYEYINIDAGYLTGSRDDAGKLAVDREKFPNGIRALSEYIHSKGLKLGVYTDIGQGSCGSGPGSYDHYEIDATTFAHDWEVDYLKVPPPYICVARVAAEVAVTGGLLRQVGES